MRTPPTSCNKNKYYHFHRDYGHNIENRIALKNEIKDLIRYGYFGKYAHKREIQFDTQNPSQ